MKIIYILNNLEIIVLYFLHKNKPFYSRLNTREHFLPIGIPLYPVESWCSLFASLHLWSKLRVAELINIYLKFANTVFFNLFATQKWLVISLISQSSAFASKISAKCKRVNKISLNSNLLSNLLIFDFQNGEKIF